MMSGLDTGCFVWQGFEMNLPQGISSHLHASQAAGTGTDTTTRTPERGVQQVLVRFHTHDIVCQRLTGLDRMSKTRQQG